MAMQGIDVSNWQAGINLAAVPCDFVICKATEGVNYVSSDCARQVEQALAAGKAVGIYHYINGSGANSEAEYFYNNCKGWMSKVVWCLDWESYGNGAWGNTSYLDQCVKRLAQLTGKPPIIYASSSVFPSSVAQANNCGTWVAQYANMNATGYQDAPWNEGAYGCTIRQYASTGRLPNYGGNLDLNKFYGDRATWNKYIAGGSGSSTPSTPTPTPSKKSNEAIANEVINGQWENDPQRSAALKAAGYDAAAIQSIVNQKLAGTTQTVKYYTVQSGDTVSAIAAKFGVSLSAISGYHSGNANLIYPGEVLTIRTSGGSNVPQSTTIRYTVKSGDSLSAIAQQYGVSISAISGYRSGNPNLIYPGEVLTIRK